MMIHQTHAVNHPGTVTSFVCCLLITILRDGNVDQHLTLHKWTLPSGSPEIPQGTFRLHRKSWEWQLDIFRCFTVQVLGVLYRLIQFLHWRPHNLL